MMSKNNASDFLSAGQGRAGLELGPIVPGAGLWENGVAVPPPRRISLAINQETGLIHQRVHLPINELQRTHPWLVQLEPESHLEELVKAMSDFVSKAGTKLFGLSFKDMSLLQEFKSMGYLVDKRPLMAGTDVALLQKAFTEGNFRSVETTRRRILVVRHTLEHATDISGFIRKCADFVGPRGLILFEVPDVELALRECDFSEIWDEHISYFTEISLLNTLVQTGLHPIHVKRVVSDGEAVVCALMSPVMTHERTSGLEIHQALREAGLFLSELGAARLRFKKILQERPDGPVFFLGANHRASNFIDLFLPSDRLAIVIDDDQRKQGLMISSRLVRILSRSEAIEVTSAPALFIVALNRYRSRIASETLTKDFEFNANFIPISDVFQS